MNQGQTSSLHLFAKNTHSKNTNCNYVWINYQ